MERRGPVRCDSVPRPEPGIYIDVYKRQMFGQARCLLELFADRLSGEQKELLAAFVEIPRMGKVRRIRTILKYGFTKNTWFRTLGQMLMIGD